MTSQLDHRARSILTLSALGLGAATWLAVRQIQGGTIGFPATCELSREATAAAFFALLLATIPLRGRLANIIFPLMGGWGTYQVLSALDRGQMIAAPTNCEIARLVISFSVPAVAWALASEVLAIRHKAAVRGEHPAASPPPILLEGFSATLRRTPQRNAAPIPPVAAREENGESYFAVCIQAYDSDAGEWRIISVNRAFETVTGYSRREAEGRSPRALLQLDALNPERTAGFAASAGAGVLRGAFLMRRSDGRVVHIDASASAMGYGAETSSFSVMIFNDMDAGRQAENAQYAADREFAVAALVRGIAHDFNNTVSIISSHSEVLQHLVANDDNKRIVTRIQLACDHAAELAGSLMNHSKLRMQAPQQVDLLQAVHRAVDLTRAILPGNITVEVRGDGIFTAWLDGSALERCLVNLAMNSRDAMAGGGSLAFEVAKAKQPPPEVPILSSEGVACISVSDNGCGMTPETQRRAAEPFFSTKEPGKGFGLGLSLVHSFVREAGGAMYIESEPGVGTRVTLYIPVTVAAASQESK